MNASSILKFLVKNQKLNLSSKEITKISSKIDLMLFLDFKTKLQFYMEMEKSNI